MNHYQQMSQYKFIIEKIKHIHYNSSKSIELRLIKEFLDEFSSLEEEGVITECLVKVLDDTDTIDFDFQTENVVTKVVFKVGNSYFDEYVQTIFISRQMDSKKHSVKLI